ncbi:hypothetical protein LRS06_17820 [Hymenobacter sp. J193]|uniref:hypothetical protein n=1 Tax=Hymenobacter sp. J193 TaxID=2898429 RepID=UPI0021518172|nr:hypothetical protein [Hymenobacter sp. J193]MCR5889596.1 hypothetical protein [Hymenobacter sp. J193]
MNDLSRIKTWLEAGRQIGKRAPVEQDGSTFWWSVGIQQWQGTYKVFFDKFDESQRVDYGSETEEVIQVTDIDALPALIKAKSPFNIEELTPLKGQKIFSPSF